MSSYLDYKPERAPAGWRKILYLNWPLVFLLAAVSSVGFLMLYSVSGGRPEVWAEPQVERFAVGMVAMIALAFVPIWFWRSIAVAAYVVGCLLLLAVDLVGHVGMGAQRWLDLGPIKLQPSELVKIALVLVLAAYYDWLDKERTSRPFWVLLPVVLSMEISMDKKPKSRIKMMIKKATTISPRIPSLEKTFSFSFLSLTT